MYLFSTFSNNTNSLLNEKNDYKKLICIAEEELNLELDKIKYGKFKVETTRNLISNNVEIIKTVGVVDKERGVYIVTIDVNRDGRKVKFEGYEQWREDGEITSSE